MAFDILPRLNGVGFLANVIRKKKGSKKKK